MAKDKVIPLSALKKKAQERFNLFIRERDKDKLCVSCGRDMATQKTKNAGHFYPVREYQSLRYNENNVHVQCVTCNLYKRGNIHEYRLGLIARIGIAEVERLELIASATKPKQHKPSREYLDAIIEKYNPNK